MKIGERIGDLLSFESGFQKRKQTRVHFYDLKIAIEKGWVRVCHFPFDSV